MTTKVFDPNPPITFDEMNAFFMEKGAERPCPDCEVTDWLIPTTPIASDTGPAFCGIIHDQYASPNGQSFLPVLVAYCDNCGHVKQYAAEVVLRWRREKNG